MCFGQTCVLTIKVCAPTSMDSGRKVRGGEPVGRWGVRGIGVVGWLEDLHSKVGDAIRRWSHM